jgi:hypothetical protein
MTIITLLSGCTHWPLLPWQGPDKAGYWKACEIELDTLTQKRDTWDVVDHEPWMNLLPSTWAFKCKHYPDGSVRKLKSRFCCRGDQQIKGVDFFDTFAPVVNWMMVCLMLILSMILGLATKQVDYTAVFVQAPIDCDPNWDQLSPSKENAVVLSLICLEASRNLGTFCG